MCFLDILVVFTLDLSQISFNLAQNALPHDSSPFLLLPSRFTTFWLGHAQKSKFSLFDFWNFFRLSISSFSFLFAEVIDLLLGLLVVKKTSEKASSRTGSFYHGAARCSGRKFWSEFFAQLFEHFCVYLRLHLADHSDLGITGKIFSSCRSWVLMMPILVKSDSVRSRKKAKARHSRLRAAQASVGYRKPQSTIYHWN